MGATISVSSFPFRLMHVAMGLVLCFSFLYIYESYISVRWAYMGFPYREPKSWEILYISVVVAIVSFLMPRKVDRPYTIVLWFLYAIVFVPTVSISFFISADPGGLVAPLSSLAAAFVGLCLFAGRDMSDTTASSLPSMRGITSPVFDNTLLLLWLVMSGVFLIVYRDIITFAGINDIYYQRSTWKATGGGVVSYLESYFVALVCPGLMAIGFVKSKKLYIVAGVLGFILLYATSAQKSALVMPVIIFAVFFSHKYKLATSLHYTSALVAVVVGCLLVLQVNGSGNYPVDLVVVRTLAAPAQSFSQYYELFSSAGFTWWSHIRGISLFVPAPDAFAFDPHWPRLGYIVGDYLHGNYTTEMNANANPFSGEGVAAAGSFGVPVIAVVLALWLRAMDFLARSWNSRFILLIMTPLAFMLTNGHLSTILLSFGGALWMVLLYTMKPGVHAGAQTLPAAHRRPAAITRNG